MEKFKSEQLNTVNSAVAMAEELVSNAYKMSENQWLRRRYDVSTLAELDHAEIVDGPFAQVVRFSGRLKGTSLGSAAYDYYKICLQDHSILDALRQSPRMRLSRWSSTSRPTNSSISSASASSCKTLTPPPRRPSRKKNASMPRPAKS